jgi:peptidyl-dipeptidase Dcp
LLLLFGPFVVSKIHASPITFSSLGNPTLYTGSSLIHLSPHRIFPAFDSGISLFELLLSGYWNRERTSIPGQGLRLVRPAYNADRASTEGEGISDEITNPVQRIRASTGIELRDEPQTTKGKIMKRALVLVTGLLLALTACTGLAPDHGENPFFASYDTEFNVHPFDRIQPAHFMPAFEEGMARQNSEIQAIVDNPGAPTFDNTIVALDRSGELLGEVSSVFFALTGSNTNDELQAINEEISPRLSAHRDEINLNKALFDRIKTLYDNREGLDLDREQAFLLKKLYQGYVRAGALLDDEDQVKLKEINQELSRLRVAFSKNLLAETNAFQLVIENEADLAGLPEGVINTAAEAAAEAELEGKWLFTTHKPSMLPFLTYAENRDLRKELYAAYTMRGNNGNENDNTEIMADIIKLRVEKAKLLGYETYADYVLENRMAGTPDKVYELLDQLWEASLPVAKNEVVEMQRIIDREGGGFKLASWDWWYYAEKLRKEKYELDDNELRPYFELNHVREGAFWVANQLYGLTFEAVEGLPKPHPDAQVFQVKEADGSHCTIMYMDWHPRASKRGGAWCGRFRGQNKVSGEEVDPIINLVCNFTKPSGDTPALLSMDEVSTLFHEFGHALDGMLSDVTYKSSFRSADFSELPSQIMEHWAFEPEVLKHYAKHYETGETIQDELIEKIGNSSFFNQGFITVEYLAASLLDMEYHTIKEAKDIDVVEYETAYFNEIGLIPEIVSRYRSSYFAHIVGGYAAGYYGYIWSGVLDSDAFEAFKETSLFDQETAQRFRTAVLERNGTADFMEMYTDFRGREPRIEPLLRNRGLLK